MKTYVYQREDKVRDYECDLQGVVNNANYLHYMEHTRHEFLLSLGENFSDLHDRGMDLFVARIEIQLKHSLRSGDRYLSCLNASKEGVKLVMSQDIYKLPEKNLFHVAQSIVSWWTTENFHEENTSMNYSNESKTEQL